MKKLLVTMLSVCFMFCWFSPIYANASSSKTVVVVGYQPNDDMVADINNTNNQGYGYQVLKKIEEISNFTFEFKEIEGDVFGALRNGEVDVAGLFFKTAEREEEFLYLDTPMHAVLVSLISKGNVAIPFDDPASIDGKTVASYPGSPANDYFEEYARENGITFEYVLNDSKDYLSVEADFYLTYSSRSDVADIGEFTTVMNLAKLHAYLVSTYGNEALMSEINEYLYEIILNEGYFFEELEEKYSDESFHALHRGLTVEELEVLREKTFKVGYEVNHEPLSFQNEEGVEDGAIIDVFEELREVYGFGVEYYAYDGSGVNSIPEGLDIILSVKGDAEYIEENFDDTQTYYEMRMLAMVPRSIIDDTPTSEEIRKASKTIGVIEYLYTNFDLFMAHAVENNIVYYDTFDELLNAYDKGQIDMAIFTESGTTYANSYFEDATANYLYSVDFDLDFRFSISKEISDEFVPIFNVMLDNISGKTYAEILLRNTSRHLHEDTFLDSISQYRYHIVIAIMALGGAMVAIYIRQQKVKNAQIKLAYTTDVLTGLPSFAHFRETATKVLHNAKANEYELISFDIDLFKLINTYYGMVKGTSIIVGISSALKEVFEGSNALICRRTSDQFIVLRKVDDKGDIKNIYKRNILPAMRNVIGDNYNISMSFGSMVISEPEQKISEIIAYADEARLSGKDQHGNTFKTFTPQMLKQYNNKINITLRMEKALEDREFVPYFQPKIDFKTLEVNGAEALVRWIPKVGNIIYPGDFIEIFEQNGFIRQLDMYMFEEVCKFITENRGKMKMPIISTNLSAITVLHKKTIDNMLSILIKYKLNTKDIELEVTESAIIGSEDEFLLQVKRMNAAGFIVSIDDFGAGVSSLNRLSAIEADVIKLDKAFFDLKDQGGRSTIVVEDVINMAKRLEMKIVAEGVETYAQALWLKGLECDLAQGYYFAKPMDADSFKEILIEDRIYDLKNKSTLID